MSPNTPLPFPRTGHPEQLVDRLLDAALAGDEQGAIESVLRALDEGADPEGILLDVIAAVQGEVGREWAENRITVAQEHAATAINERVITALGTHPAARTAATRGRITVACVDGEWHALPARLLAEVLKLRGWRIDFLGAQLPTPHLIAHLHTTGADAVALSSSIATRLPTTHAAISACQAIGVPVLVGGAAFGPDGRYAKLLGADAWAPDARTAADRLARSPLSRPQLDHQPIDDLPHLADQEYTLVTRNSGSLVRTVFAALEDALPFMKTYTDLQRERTAEDLASIVEFLATALYLDDEDLFMGFIAWTAQVLSARGVPAQSLGPALHLLALELKDFPRATRVLHAATRTVTAYRPSEAGNPA
ncbi:methanogenic corrinoid protein MtbC1 [Streptomyces sp. 2132.2]|uniref:cobalamin B12-binding domain-containing protein n=1 Tax=Streptomyces TaxID=1883 RepID=UPI000F46975A|nr:B12-binding domain-containing protein [Streptomyces sp. 2132.2]ROQ93834.1 methanogenic corrinoid protein MtbC1 [Streptomyces sp. 2132.2]